MRLIKMFGLAAVAAVAAMAFIGASSASAKFPTALCKVDTSLVCAAGDIYSEANKNGHVEGLAVNPELLSNLGNVVCNHSVILGQALGLATAPNGTAQLSHLELIDFTGNCRTGAVACTVTAITLGLVDVLKTAANLGTVTSLGSEVRVVCAGVINCTFGGEPTGHGLGSVLPLTEPPNTSSLGTIVVNEAVLTGKGLLCPAVGKWDASYTIQLPHDIFITE